MFVETVAQCDKYDITYVPSKTTKNLVSKAAVIPLTSATLRKNRQTNQRRCKVLVNENHEAGCEATREIQCNHHTQQQLHPRIIIDDPQSCVLIWRRCHALLPGRAAKLLYNAVVLRLCASASDRWPEACTLAAVESRSTSRASCRDADSGCGHSGLEACLLNLGLELGAEGGVAL